MVIEPKIESYRRFNRYYTMLEPLLAHPEIRAYTMLVLSLFTMSFFGYFAIRPTLTTVINLRQQIKDMHFVEQKLQDKINALSEAQVGYENIKPDLEIISTALPPETRFPGFVKSLEKLATESGTIVVGLNFQNINLSSFEATAAASEIPIGFSLTISGDYANLADFVKRLSRFERLATIEKIGLAIKKEKEKETLHLTLVGKTFYVQ